MDQNPSFGYHPKCKDMKLNHLGFADDLMVFCRADVESAQIIKEKLVQFGKCSGLEINPAKSHAFVAGVDSETKQNIISTLQFTEGRLPVRYLGLPLISTRLKDRDCRPIIDNIKRKLARWSTKTLSYAGRLQLINSVLFHTQVYWSSVVALPVSILKTIESLCRNFLWKGCDGSNEKRGMTLVAWQKVCVPRNEGGLGVKQLRTWNEAAMTKHL